MIHKKFSLYRGISLLKQQDYRKTCFFQRFCSVQLFDAYNNVFLEKSTIQYLFTRLNTLLLIFYNLYAIITHSRDWSQPSLEGWLINIQPIRSTLNYLRDDFKAITILIIIKFIKKRKLQIFNFRFLKYSCIFIQSSL